MNFVFSSSYETRFSLLTITRFVNHRCHQKTTICNKNVSFDEKKKKKRQFNVGRKRTIALSFEQLTKKHFFTHFFFFFCITTNIKGDQGVLFPVFGL